MERRYIASIAGIAVFILVAGLIFRPDTSKPEVDSEPPSLLTQFSIGDEADQVARYLSDRATELSKSVHFIPALAASGVRWNDSDWIATTTSSTPLLLTYRKRQSGAEEPLAERVRPRKRQWLLIVAKNALDSAVWVASIRGGTSVGLCAGTQREELAVSVPMSGVFAGAGIFASDGTKLGMVLNCGDRLAPISAASISAWISDLQAADTLMLPALSSSPATRP